MTTEARLPDELRERLDGGRSVGAITGAGVSSECGIRTYRGRGGIYNDPVEGDRTVEALSGSTLAIDPDRTWRAVAKLARQTCDAVPGVAHRALVEIEDRVERFVLLTQNVDGLHQAAGSRNVIDMLVQRLVPLASRPRPRGAGALRKPVEKEREIKPGRRVNASERSSPRDRSEACRRS